MTEETTTQEGVENESVASEEQVQETQQGETPALERDEIIARIAQRRKDEREATEDDDDEPQDDQPEETVPEAAQDESEDVEDSPTQEDDEQDKQGLVALKVMGRTMYKTQQDIEDAGGVAAIQKSLAGDIKMQDAANREQKLRQREKDLDAREKRLSAQQKAKDVKPAEKVDMKEVAKEIVLGDTDKVAEALEKIAAQNAPQAKPQVIDEAKVTRNVEQKVRRDMEIKAAQDEFARDFSDINDSPAKKNLANEHTKILMRENPSWTPKEVLTEAGKRTRADLTEVEPQPKKDDSKLAAKKHRKAVTVDTIEQAAARKTGNKTTYKPKTPREIFESLQASRSH